MSRITEMLTLAKLCYAQANDTLNPEAKKTLQDIGNQYAVSYTHLTLPTILLV